MWKRSALVYNFASLLAYMSIMQSTSAYESGSSALNLPEILLNSFAFGYDRLS